MNFKHSHSIKLFGVTFIISYGSKIGLLNGLEIYAHWKSRRFKNTVKRIKAVKDANEKAARSKLHFP